MAVVIGLLVMIGLSQSSRGPAVKDITADLARDNLAFDEFEVKTLSMKSSEKPISSWTNYIENRYASVHPSICHKTGWPAPK